MNNYLDKLAAASPAYPLSLGGLAGKDMINESALSKLMKARILQEVQKRYLGMGHLNPIEKYGQASASAMTQANGDF